ncbi:MAG: bifunctional ornithine acetyltransferase/N-acetylglutamate synthase, partial [Hyphomicrobiales bacterium]|nr:bifunctional ornithine acetyltransferase/N-acetylglutamate synthase [Hyphomicrobiales bacterium]
TIEVKGAVSKPSARRVGFAVANSPLVKTALSGEDANWGRIAMAVGKSGERIDAARLAITMGGVTLARRGAAVVLGGSDKRKLARHMRAREIHIGISLGVGKGVDEVWTCDLSHGYVSINANYRS